MLAGLGLSSNKRGELRKLGHNNVQSGSAVEDDVTSYAGENAVTQEKCSVAVCSSTSIVFRACFASRLSQEE